MGLQLQAALLQALVAYLHDGYPQVLHMIPSASQLTTNLLVPAIVRAAAWAVIVFMLLSDAEAGYGAAASVAVADIVWAGAGYRLGYLSQLLAGVNATIAAIIGLVALAAVVSQAQARVRLRVVADRKLDSAHMFHHQALVYVRQGKWALAALHWHLAITRAPREPIFYKGLGRAQVRLGRYSEAVRSFRSGAEAAPGDAEFIRLIEWVRTLARKS
jgi:tetratricopeptide (TPR) repeat protein